MKFIEPAGTNPIDRMTVVGRAQDRIDGPRKTTGTAPYAYERHADAPDAAYGWIIGSAIAKGRIRSINLDDARGAPGVLGIVTAANAGPLTAFIASYSSPEGLFFAKLSAASTMAIAPILILGWFSQKQLVRGLTFGAVK